MDCTQFEALLSEALDGALGEPVRARFQAHAAACADCGPMLAAAQAGMSWLKSLPEVEPPRNLVRNILIATSGAQAAAPLRQAGPTSPWGERLRQWTRPLATAFSAVLQPRFALSLGMAFFSVMVLLNAAGLHLTSLRAADLRPSA
ncbi:MAG TPA: zf-HC2 domain-containing protein, partial [bacterium]|nr:zf-HC2 domain-containing protein [bacterium]